MSLGDPSLHTLTVPVRDVPEKYADSVGVSVSPRKKKRPQLSLLEASYTQSIPIP